MAITVNCKCGSTYNLKDEYAGKTVQCPKCQASLSVGLPGAVPASTFTQEGSHLFHRNKFLLRQKALTISEKYSVGDEQGNSIMYIERPAHFFRNVFALLMAIFCGFAVMFGGIAAAGILSGDPQQQGQKVSDEVIVAMTLASFVLGMVAIILVAKLLVKKRHITFYKDDTKQEVLLEILQDKKLEFIHASYLVRDEKGKPLARFNKNYLMNLFRRRWDCFNADGNRICVAKEDSVILALLRRFIGPLFGLLRTNFLIFDPSEQNVIGEFNRKFTLLDRYVLDMSADAQGKVDRRVALALGVMLDTGERR